MTPIINTLEWVTIDLFDIKVGDLVKFIRKSDGLMFRNISPVAKKRDGSMGVYLRYENSSRESYIEAGKFKVQKKKR